MARLLMDLQKCTITSNLIFSILPSVCLANEFPFIICQVSINAFSYASSYDWTKEGGKCLHIVILLLFPCSLMVSTQALMIWLHTIGQSWEAAKPNWEKEPEEEKEEYHIWEAWLKELSHKSFQDQKKASSKKGP